MAVAVGESKYEEGVIGDFYTRNITARTKVEFLGDWIKVGDIFKRLPKELKVEVYKAIFTYSVRYQREVKSAIRKNGPKSKTWNAYSDGYAAYKKLHGQLGYPSFYRFKGNLYRAITIDTDGRRSVRVTIDKNARVSNTKSDLTASQLMNILEHGSIERNIAARPLFGPVWVDMGGNKGLRDFVAGKIGKKLKKYSSTI